MILEKKSRPIGVIMLYVLILFQGLSGIAGGIGLIGDPSGESLQIPLIWLKGSPFHNYLVPGIVLLIILGIFPVGVFLGLLREWPWAWHATLFIAIALLIWIIVEIMVIGYQPQPPLQLIYSLVGLLMLVTALLPQVRKHFGVK
ncbi:MAG: hypothetical protein KQI35_01315 [Bacteroidetes bacterium]|nr:hypothetical protein [Bacteroidota bacterium]